MISVFPTITRREWVGALVVGIIAGVIGSWPWIASSWKTAPGTVFLGTNIPDVLDSQVYYAFIQGSADHGAYANLFTSETQPAALWNPLWWLLGMIVRFTHSSPLTVFWAAKAVLGVGLVVLIYRLAAVFFQPPRWRFLALGLAVFGSGFGWLALMALHGQPGLVWLYQRIDLIPVLPTDLTYSAGYVWMSILHSPLFVLSEILLISIWGLLVMAHTTPKKYLIHVAGALTLLLGFVHPYDLALLGGVIVAAVIAGIVGETLDQAQVKKILRHLMVLLLWAAPAVLYYAWLIFFVPAISGWNTNNLLQTTNFRNVLVGYGALSVFTYFGIRGWWKKNQAATYLIGWLGAAIGLMYLPMLRWQAKMIIGLSVPIGLLATAGVQTLWRRTTSRRWKAVLVLGILMAVMTPPIFLSRAIESQTHEVRYQYATTDLMAALRWIKTSTPRGRVVLGDIWTGNLVPQFADRATYLGHHHQTVDYQHKLAIIRRWFFADAGLSQEKNRFILDNHIAYVVWGPAEQRLGTFDPGAYSWLKPVYTNASVTVFEVVR